MAFEQSNGTTSHPRRIRWTSYFTSAWSRQRTRSDPTGHKSGWRTETPDLARPGRRQLNFFKDFTRRAERANQPCGPGLPEAKGGIYDILEDRLLGEVKACFRLLQKLPTLLTDIDRDLVIAMAVKPWSPSEVHMIEFDASNAPSCPAWRCSR